MLTNTNFPPVFDALKKILVPYARTMIVKHDTPTHYYLDTKFTMTHNKQPLFFAAVRQGKAYVSFYLMPMYACPELEEGMSAGLKKHKQGKSCFNFKEIDTALFAELKALTKAGAERFKKGDLPWIVK